MSTFETKNGHFPDGGDVARRVLGHMDELGETPSVEDPQGVQGRLFLTDDEPKRDQDRHPEDPPGALEDAAEEVTDPERIRVRASRLGKALQAISSERFDRLVRQVYAGVRGVRAGAIIGPAQVSAGKQLQIVETTDEDVARILVDGYSDAVTADRKEQKAVPAAVEKIKECDREVEKCEANVAKADLAVIQARPEDASVARPHGGLWAWVPVAPWLALLLFAVDVSVTTINLQPEIANLLVTSQLGSYLIAGGISVTLIGASAMAGFALAAIRLSGRLVGALMVGLFGLLLMKLTGGLDAIRTGSTKGVETLTATTLAACYVAGLTGYAGAAWRDFKERRALILKAGTPLGDALVKRDEVVPALEVAKAARDKAKAELDALRAEIEQLRDRATRAFGAALTRMAQGTAAQVEFATIRALCRTGIEQEIAAHDVWSVAIATLSRDKARAEKFPKGEAIRNPNAGTVAPEPADKDRGLTTLQKLAIAVLGLGAVGGLIFGPATLAIGAGIATILLLLSGRVAFLTRGSKETSVTPEVPPEPEPIGSPASDDNPFYLHQPDHMEAKYRAGETGPGQHQ